MSIPVILASKSPSRWSLLVHAGIRPTVRVSQVDEPATLKAEADRLGVTADQLAPEQQVATLAQAKAQAVRDRLQAVVAAERQVSGQQVVSRPLEDGYGSVSDRQSLPEVVKAESGMMTAQAGPLIVGCDSLFDCEGQIQGKPHTPERALARLTAMEGKSGTLWTGHCLIDCASGRQVQALSQSQVTFGHYQDCDIQAYVASGEPLEVAGSFTLEGLGSAFIDQVQGSPSGVMGLSIPTLRQLVEELGFSWVDLWNAGAVGQQEGGSAGAPKGNVHQPGDGWIQCACGHKHWGLNGAAGVLLVRRDPTSGKASQVLLQHRAQWSAEGGTWGVPGGAIADGESPVEGALRESYEEANIRPEDIDVVGSYVEDHGPWAYTTVFAVEKAGHQVTAQMNDDESLALDWVPLEEVSQHKLLAAFGRDWPDFYDRLLHLPELK